MNNYFNIYGLKSPVIWHRVAELIPLPLKKKKKRTMFYLQDTLDLRTHIGWNEEKEKITLWKW